MLGLWASAAAAGGYSVMGGSCQVDSNGCASSTNYPNDYPDNDQCTMSCMGCPVNTVIQVVDFFTMGWDVLTINGQSYSGTMNPGNTALNLPGAPAGALQWQAGSSAGVTGRKWKVCPVARPSTTSTATTITSTSTSTGTTVPGIVTTAPVVANVVATSTSNPMVMMQDGCSSVGQTCDSSYSTDPYQRCGLSMTGSLACLYVPLYASCAGKKEGDTCDEVPYNSGETRGWYSGGTCSQSAEGDCFFSNKNSCGALQCNGAQQSSLSRAATLGLGLGLGLSALAYILVSGGYLLFVKYSLYKKRWIPSAHLNLQPGPSGYAREMIVETF